MRPLIQLVVQLIIRFVVIPLQWVLTYAHAVVYFVSQLAQVIVRMVGITLGLTHPPGRISPPSSNPVQTDQSPQ